jgi:hypothetical protein
MASVEKRQEQYVKKVIGVDWGDETRWVLVGRTTKNKFYVIDTGVFDDIDTMQQSRS